MLTILLYESNKPPLQSAVRKFGDGSYAVLSRTGTSFSCRIFLYQGGKLKLSGELQPNSLGGYLTSLSQFLDSGLIIKGVLHRALNPDGINRSLAKLRKPPTVLVEYFTEVDTIT